MSQLTSMPFSVRAQRSVLSPDIFSLEQRESEFVGVKFFHVQLVRGFVLGDFEKGTLVLSMKILSLG